MRELLTQHKTILIALAAALLASGITFAYQQKRIEVLRTSESGLLNNALTQVSLQEELINLDNALIGNDATDKRQVLLNQIDKNTKALDPILKNINEEKFWLP